MKRTICFIVMMCMVFTAAILTVAAADVIGVVYPSDIVCNDDKTEIRKVYECKTDDAACEIPREAFEQGGFSYEFFDMLREEISVTERKVMTEGVTVSSKSNDMDTVMSLLPPPLDMEYDDGFCGTLALNTSSIKSVISGYGSTSKDIRTTRTYPNLSDADMQYIPKTTEHNGKTLNFEGVQWQTDNTRNVDDYEIGNRYTAIVTYSGTESSSYIKGYTVTAEYSGEVTKTYIDKIRYTAIFTGTEIPPPEPPKEPINWKGIGIISALAALIGGCAFIQRLLSKKRHKHEQELETELGKEQISDEEDNPIEYDYYDDDFKDDLDDFPDFGG